MTQTSITDEDQYLKFCLLASQNENVFNNFKQNTVYRQVLEHVSEQQGLDFYNEFRNNKKLVDSLDQFTMNDQLGFAQIVNYEFKKISASTLRYVKILNDLLEFEIENANIIEIGGGYGGQCTIIKKYLDISSYSIVDLKEPLALTKKYLTKLNLNENVNFIDGKDTSNEFLNSYDLVISNYAISECSRVVQDYYIENILSKSKQGYIIYNQIFEYFKNWSSEKVGYNHEKFAEKLKSCNKNVQIEKEVPLTSSNNVLITWK